MTKTLDVYLHREFVGRLIQDNHGLLLFEYDENWLNNPDAIALSISLPLRNQQFRGKECKGFFGGILPEESRRRQIAKNLGISARNDYSMLEQIGGECAGAVTFIPGGQPLSETDHQYRELSDADLSRILRELPHRPLMAGEAGVRLSLAGAQDKIAVYVKEDRVSLPLGGAPSTHILKPAIERFEGVVFNEAVCMKLASAVGIPTAEVEFRQVEDIDYLMINRYDRRTHETSEGTRSKRLHQEDFCQALGIPSEKKYQGEGGPGLKQCFALLRNVSRIPLIDLQRLLDAVIFNVLIGNHDAHAKNFSLLYGERTEGKRSDIRLAPLYDLVSTVYYPELTSNMAMTLGSEYRSDRLAKRHFEKFAEDAGLAKPIVVRRVTELAQSCRSALINLDMCHQVANDVMSMIDRRCEKFGETFSVPP